MPSGRSDYAGLFPRIGVESASVAIELVKRIADKERVLRPSLNAFADTFRRGQASEVIRTTAHCGSYDAGVSLGLASAADRT